MKNKLIGYLYLLRPYQWTKNLLIFLPFFTAQLKDLDIFFSLLIAFFSFSLISSCAYTLNDLLDVENDKRHIRKKERPFASSLIPISHGKWIILILLMLSSLLATTINYEFLFYILFYFLFTSFYSLRLKKLIIVDLCVLSALYTIRIYVGGLVADIPISTWLLSFSLFFFFSLAGVKRQTELAILKKTNSMTNYSGRGYTLYDLNILQIISTSSGMTSILIFIMYMNSNSVIDLYGSPYSLWIISSILMYWITRINLLSNRAEIPDDPIMFSLKDKASLLCISFIIILFIISYVFK